MPRDTRASTYINYKPEDEKAKMYKAIQKALHQGPMTIDQLAAAVPFPRARITQACQAMCVVGDAHIGSRPPGPGGISKRCYHIGPGENVPSAYPRKNNRPLAAKVLDALTGPMTVQDVAQKVFYTRPAIQLTLQLLCASGRVRICGHITQQGGTTLFYARTSSL